MKAICGYGNPETGECLRTRTFTTCWSPFAVTCMAVLPDGKVVTGGDDKMLRIWDPARRHCLRTLAGYDIYCVAALPDGKVVSGSYEGDLRIWDPATGQCLLIIKDDLNAKGYLARCQGLAAAEVCLAVSLSPGHGTRLCVCGAKPN